MSEKGTSAAVSAQGEETEEEKIDREAEKASLLFDKAMRIFIYCLIGFVLFVFVSAAVYFLLILIHGILCFDWNCVKV